MEAANPVQLAAGARVGRSDEHGLPATDTPADHVYYRVMSKVCYVCAKGPSFGNNRSRSMVATKRRFNPNLQRVRIDDKGTPRRVYVCTRCLKAGKVTKAS